MPAVKITNKPVSTPGDQTHFLVTQPELPEGYAPTGQETEEELAELKVESLREIEMDDMVELFQRKFAFDSEPTAESGKPVTSAGIKAALDAADAKIGELKENLIDLLEVSDTKAAAIYETASGEIASFSDGADDMPMPSVKVAIEPIQDLHGYDSPWPAGGGVNKCNPNEVVLKDSQSLYKLIATINADSGEITIGGTPSYQASGVKQVSLLNYPGAYENGYKCKFFVVSKSSNVASIKSEGIISSNDDIALVFNVSDANSLQFVLKPMFYEGSTEPTAYLPYSNICPISGRTGVSVVRNGKNLANRNNFSVEKPSWCTDAYWVGLTKNEDETYTLNRPIGWGGYGRVYLGTFSTGEYTVSFALKSTANVQCAAVLYVTDKHTWITNSYNIIDALQSAGRYSLKVTTTKECDFWLAVGPYVDNNAQVVSGDYQVELGSTATDYEPYKGSTYSVNWETEAGTVYGGTLDVVSGKLVVDRASVDIGVLPWSLTGDRFSAGALSPKALSKSSWDIANPIAICSQYKYGNINNGSGTDKAIGFYNAVLYARDTTYTTSADFKAAMDGVQLVYKLAKPTEIQLTPQEVRTLLGVNNIWSDGGDMEVEYPADTKMYIDTKIAEAVAAAMA
jgi:hypothetical protein